MDFLDRKLCYFVLYYNMILMILLILNDRNCVTNPIRISSGKGWLSNSLQAITGVNDDSLSWNI